MRYQPLQSAFLQFCGIATLRLCLRTPATAQSGIPAGIIGAPADEQVADELAHSVALATGVKPPVNQPAARGESQMLVGSARGVLALAGNGPAAPAITRYFGRYKRVIEAYSESLFVQGRSELDEAPAMVSDARRNVSSFFKKGCVTSTSPSMRNQREAGSFAPAVTSPSKPDMTFFDTAVAAWCERDAYVESLRQDFVISYFRVRYNDQNRAFVPLRKMLAYRNSAQ